MMIVGTNESGHEPSWDKVNAHEQEMFQRIRETHLKGHRRDAAYLQRRYLTSFDARLVAASTAYDKLKRWRRPELSKLPEIAKNINALRGTDERVDVRWVPKKNNSHEFRLLMDFGIQNRALQYQIRRCIEARLDLHPMQFALNGGRDVAIERVQEFLLQGFHHVAELDIKNCYPSFDGEKLTGLLPIPKEVTEKVILSRNLNLYPVNMWDSSQSGDVSPEDIEYLAEYLAEARQGIAQGSAVSSVVAEIVLAHVLAQMPDVGVVLTYADNILLMARSAKESVSMRIALSKLLSEHPAGPLKLNKPKTYKPGQPVEFLGYRLTVNGAKCYIEPSQKNLKQFHAETVRRLKNIEAEGTSIYFRKVLVSKLRRYVKSWPNSFKLWPGGEQHWKKYMSLVDKTNSTFDKQVVAKAPATMVKKAAIGSGDG